MRPPVLVLHNVPTPAEGGACAESEAGVLEQVRAVSAALDALGVRHRVAGVRSLRDLPGVLLTADEPVVFNLVEALPAGSPPGDVNLVPGLVEAFGKGCTGNPSPALMTALDKWQAKAILQAAGLPTPEARVVPVGARLDPAELPAGRYIVKPAATDASEGIHARSVLDLPGGPLAERVAEVHAQFAQPALVERFFGRRELNVTVFQRGGAVEVMPLAEIDFSAFGPERPRIVDYDAKWRPDSFGYHNTPRRLPAPLPQAWARRVREAARQAWAAFGCRDYARVDFRLDEDGGIAILEVNPNPDISPDAGLPAALAAGGVSYMQFVEVLVSNAYNRAQNGTAVPATPAAPPAEGVTIRRSEPGDRPALLEAMASTRFFRPDEIEIALEVLDEALAKGPQGHYQSFTLVDAAGPAGWVCFGPTPCTVGTFDVYWIAVSADRQGRGYGARLMAFAEDGIRERGGRLAIVETNGREMYHPTRQFYRKVGYDEGARVRDFYAPGDDKVVFVKRL